MSQKILAIDKNTDEPIVASPTVDIAKTYVLEAISADLSILERELQKRGWRKARPQSKAFDFKWTWTKDRLQNLRDYQIANHFSNYDEVGSKMGLMTNLRRSNETAFINSIFPRCYLIHSPEVDPKTAKVTRGSEHELLYADFERERMYWNDKKCMNEMFDGFLPFLPPRQPGIDGDRNMWIMKPSAGARGVGIGLTTQLNDLKFFPYSSYIIQKYVETPFLDTRLTGGIEKKFDIRQFALVTSLKPLTIFMFQQCYLRFCSEEYFLPSSSLQARHCPVGGENRVNGQNRLISNVKQQTTETTEQFHNHNETQEPQTFEEEDHSRDYVYAHLTNHQVQKKAPNFNASTEIPEDQMTCASFRAFLNNTWAANSTEDVWSTKVQPTLEKIIIESLRVWPKEGHRTNSFEVLGFDIFLDSNLKPHLIEINTNPGMHLLTKVVRPHHFKLQQDLFKVILDKRHLWEKVSNPQNLTIGDFRLIYKEQL